MIFILRPDLVATTRSIYRWVSARKTWLQCVNKVSLQPCNENMKIPTGMSCTWISIHTMRSMHHKLHQPRLWFITGGYLVKRWFLPAATRARGQSNDLNREILASNLFNCRKEVINAPPVPSISRCIRIVYQHKNVWEYQWSNFIYNCLSTFLHYVCCKDALLDCSAPGGERCESLTRVDEIILGIRLITHAGILSSIHVSEKGDRSWRLIYLNWQVSRQPCCWDACQISEWSDSCNSISSGFEILEIWQ